ncbi:YdaU family protein [Nitrosomonas ureae]|nr:YdaU family protein [Nitrosomonas ureae]
MNIGDYAKKAGRLSMLEHGAYTLLIHSCYDRERFPTLEEALEWCWVRTPEEEAAVKFVLSKFFDLVDGVYYQNRIQEEISKYHENASTNKRIATEREEKRRNRTRTVHEPCSSVNEPPPNQEPRTINQEPLTSEEIIHTDYPSQQSSNPTPAASVCLAIKKIGIIDLNPSHPELLMLIEAGATIDEFMHAARTAKDKSKGFAYVLGIVKGQRTEAAKAKGKVLQGKIPNKAEALLQNNLETVSDWEPPEMRAQK